MDFSQTPLKIRIDLEFALDETERSTHVENMKDVLLITWHGIHELDIFPGLPDTGGQNIYVQNMAEQIHDQYDARVIILNRGGFVHPYTKRMRDGMSKDPQRELYVLHVADDIKAFVRKEYLTGALIRNAVPSVLNQLPGDFTPSLIVSHFWDGGYMGELLGETFKDAVHVWIPHEPVGMKKAPLTEEEREKHGIFIRERYEKRVTHNAHLIGSTSKLVRKDLELAYGRNWDEKIIDVFPGVDTERFHPVKKKCFSDATGRISGQEVREHAEYLDLPEELFKRPHMCEFGRSDVLKDKDKAVEVFAKVAKSTEDLNLFLNLDENMEPGVAKKIHETIEREGIADRIHIFSPKDLPQSGPGAHILPDIVKTAKLFLSMSVMEGFGMAACEAAACGIPVIGTDQIPVVTDVIEPAGGGKVIPAKDVDAASKAVLEILGLEEEAYCEMSRKAYESVIPRYTWKEIIQNMFEQIADKGFDLLA